MQILSGRIPASWTDLVLFKVSWLLLVVYQALALVPVLVIVIFRCLAWRTFPGPALIVLVAVVTGLTMDLLLMLGGVLVFQDKVLPFWHMMLWLSFALTIPVGLSFVSRLHPAIQSVIGAVAGLAGYLAGYLLNVVSFGLPVSLALAVITLLWALYLPTMYALWSRL